MGPRSAIIGRKRASPRNRELVRNRLSSAYARERRNFLTRARKFNPSKTRTVARDTKSATK